MRKLKTTKRLPREEIPKWKPKTVGDYQKLAKALADDLPTDRNLPELTLLYHNSIAAFTEARELITESRHPVSAPHVVVGITDIDNKHVSYITHVSWLLFYMSVREHLSRLRPFGIFWYEATTFYDTTNWPKSPKSMAFYEAGWSALEAMNAFSQSIKEIVEGVLFWVGLEPIKLKDYVAQRDAINWLKVSHLRRLWGGIREEINGIIPSAEWPDSIVEREYNSLLCQAEYEYQQAAGLQKTKTADSDLPPEARTLAVLAEHPDWSDTKVARQAGVNRTSLYRMQKYMKARELLKKGKNALPQGSKDAETGDMEAWEND